jgi:cyclic-di-GMP phosphodiesterase TipF (flagellum assembly factor)
MIRVSTIFVALCMALIAASLGFLLYRIVGLSPLQSVTGAVAALTALIMFNAVSMRLRDKNDLSGQITDLAHGTADLARQVAEFGRRLHAVENRMGTVNHHADRRVDPLRQEISELGLLMKQLALSVAEHDDLLHAPPSEPAAPPIAAILPAQVIKPVAPVVDAPPVAAVLPQAGGYVATPVAAADMSPQVREAVDAGRIDLYLQPMVTLPQRKVRYYEAMARLRDGADNVLSASDFMPAAEKAGVMPRIDEAVLLRCVQVLRRLMVRNKEVGLFCNISIDTLRDKAAFSRCLDFLDANRALAPFFVLEFKQSTFRNLGPVESDHLAALGQRGFKFSIDNVSDLRFEPRELADRGVRFLKVPAQLLLDPQQSAGSDIHPSDLSDMLGRFGIDLVAERIEGERAVVDLLDFDVRFGQGFLFAPPRPLRPDATSAVDNSPQPVRTAHVNAHVAPPEGAVVTEPTSPPEKARGIAALLARRITASN